MNGFKDLRGVMLHEQPILLVHRSVSCHFNRGEICYILEKNSC